MMEPQIDPVSVAVALATTLVGGALAPYVGPYIVIAAAGLAGSGFALTRWHECSRTVGTVYVLGMTALSLLLTVPLTELLLMMTPDSWHPSQRWLLAPMAAIIAGIGHDWPSIGRWVVERAGRLIERRTET